MHFRCDKKIQRTSPSTKSVLKSKSTSKNGTSAKKYRDRNQAVSNKGVLSLECLHVLEKKYSGKQKLAHFNEKIEKLVLNKNKVNIQLKLLCSEKQYMTTIFDDPLETIKSKISSLNNNTSNNSNIIHKFFIMPQLSSDAVLWKMLRDYKKFRFNILNKIRKNQSEKCLKNQTPILSTALDDSENNLKNLVNNIDNMMIKCRLSQSSINIINELRSKQSSRTEIRLSQKDKNGQEYILDGEGNGISEIIEEIERENEERISECMQKEILKKRRRLQKSKQMKHKFIDIQNLQKLLTTEPLINPKKDSDEKIELDDEYGILKQPPREVFFRRKQEKRDGYTSSEKRSREFSFKSNDRSEEKKKKEGNSRKKMTKSTKHQKTNQSLPKREERQRIGQKKKVKQIKSSYYKGGRQSSESTSVCKASHKNRPKKFIF